MDRERDGTESREQVRGGLDEARERIDALKRGRRRQRILQLGALLALLFVWVAPARSVPPFPVSVHELTPNTAARASQVNANFAVLADAVNTNDARLEALEARGDRVPSGTLAFFATGACPAGWAPHDAANGRYLLAVAGESTAGGTAGTALGDRENRTHAHDIQHRHVWSEYERLSGTDTRVWRSWLSETPGTDISVIYSWGSGVDGSGHRPLASTSAGTFHTDDSVRATSGPRLVGALAPYIQLRACRKN